MITKNISLKNFKLKNKNQKLKQKLTSILSEENEVINSLKKSYKNSYTKKLINKFKKISFIDDICRSYWKSI